MTIIYDFLFLILAIGFLPYLVLRKKFHRGFGMRLGFFPAAIENLLREKAQQPSIWIHAVSVGEVAAIAGLLGRIKKKFPDYRIVLTTVTTTGYSLAVSQLKEVDTVVFAPVDFSFVVQKYIRLIRPRIYIAAETEIWPNLFRALSKNAVPIVLVNGRISDQAFPWYFRGRFLFKKILEGVSIFCMQSQVDAKRIVKLGIPAQKVMVVGNLKFDDLPSVQEFQLKDFGFIDLCTTNDKKNETIWIAGSTHPGEEEIVLKIFKSLTAQFGDLRLIIAPRHIERTNEVANLIVKFGFQPMKLSELSSKGSTEMDNQKVILVDTIGQLKSLYSLSRIVFVGKSLAVGGGQNIIEPAFFGNAVVVGPLMQNFREIVEVFLKDQAVLQVKDAKELEERMKFLLDHPAQRDLLGQAAQKVIEKYRGATDQSLTVIVQVLTDKKI